MIIQRLRAQQSEGDLDTSRLWCTLEPLCCSGCGHRMGWNDTDFAADTVVALCDDCAAEYKQEEEEPEGLTPLERAEADGWERTAASGTWARYSEKDGDGKSPTATSEELIARYGEGEDG